MPINRIAFVVAIFTFVGCSTDVPSTSDRSYSVDLAKAAQDCSFKNYMGRTPWRCSVTNGHPVIVFERVSESTRSTRDTSWGFQSASFQVTPGKEYVVCLGLSGMLPTAMSVKPGARIEWLASDGNPVKVVDALGNDVDASSPVEFPLRKSDCGLSRTVTKGIVPPFAVRARIFFGLDHPDLEFREYVVVEEVAYHEHTMGKTWRFSDVEPPELQMLTPSPTADIHVPIRFRLHDATGVDVERVSCTINGRLLQAHELKREGSDVFVYCPSVPWDDDSVVQVKVDCADVNGYAASEWGFVAITGSSARHAKWSVRDDGMILRDGNPFFPLGLTSVHSAPWCEGSLDQGLSDLKSNGVNFVHTYMVRGRKNHAQSAHYEELVAAAEKHGVVFMAEPAMRSAAWDIRSAMIARNTLFGRSSSAQGCWGIGDDTSTLQSPRDLKRMHRFCKAVDPWLLTVSVDAVCAPTQQSPYVPFADVLVLEDYPIRKDTPQDDEMATFAEVIDNGWEAIRLSGARNRSVWSMPQSFKGWRSWHRYPTKDELRCMMYLSLACRARGIVAYTSYAYNGNVGPLNSASYKADFYAVLRELVALMPSLTLRDAIKQPVVTVVDGPMKNVRGGDTVRCLLKSDGLLIVANSSHESVKVSIALPSGESLTRELPRFAGWAERITQR